MQELIVLKKVEQLFYKVYPTLVNYPKAEKYALCVQIKQAFFDTITYISLGAKVKSKRKTYLQEADAHIQVIKILMKLSKERRYISNGFFAYTDECITEIEKMLSGFIRSIARDGLE